MRFLLSIFLLLVPCINASAAFLEPTVVDEITSRTSYFFVVLASDYKSVTRENTIEFLCHANGERIVSMHTGGRHTGAGHFRDKEILIKLDDDEPLEIEMRDLLNPPLFNQLRSSRVLLVRIYDGDRSYRFDLDGLGDALSIFDTQCDRSAS